MSHAIEVHFINANSGQTIGRTELPLEQLPASFEAETTIHIGETNWIVVRADPPSAVEFAQTIGANSNSSRPTTSTPSPISAPPSGVSIPSTRIRGTASPRSMLFTSGRSRRSR